jgi:hypothetical protein
MQIDTLGKRYGLLPSEVLMRANTFDLYIMDAALTFENYHQKKANSKGPIAPNLTTEELCAIKGIKYEVSKKD